MIYDALEELQRKLQQFHVIGIVSVLMWEESAVMEGNRELEIDTRDHVQDA